MLLTTPVKTFFQSDSKLYEEWEKLEKEKELLKEHRSAFDSERQKFTDAAIRLGRDVSILRQFCSREA